MKYTIRIAAIAGDVILLGLVADTMALRDATAGGPDYLPEIRQGRYATYGGMLLKNVRSAALAVCDDVGDSGRPDAIVASRIAEGLCVVLLPGRLGDKPSEVNVDATWLCNLFVKLKALNDWAARRGDEFVLSHDGVAWVEAAYDEQRGKVTSVRQRVAGFAEPGVTDSINEPSTTAAPMATGMMPVPMLTEVEPGATTGSVPIPRTSAQDAAILNCLCTLGHNPLELPPNDAGKPGVKAKARAALGSNGMWSGSTVFDKAWERLSRARAIAYRS